MTPNDPPPHADESATSGRFAYEGLERVFHEKARLSIMTSLVAHPRGLVFADLKEQCALTDGNLSRHLQVLSESGFVAIVKGYQHNRPQTLCLLTDEGRRRFLDYINVLESVVADALAASGTAADPKTGPRSKPGKAIAEGLSPA